ncbi:unnamed protein product [Lactuca saligna]|uniref:Uncharacterized protein n=1 Tax=Lactuca saligna TaxID=75948 RepID=A0AA35YS90_LACSI|nr:unnamed protein product [Lactuca saligna]
MSRKPASLSRRLGDGNGIPFMGSLNPKLRPSPFLSIALVLVGAFLIIGYVYSGSGGSNIDKVALSRLEGGVSCSAEINQALLFLKKKHMVTLDSMHKVLHVGPSSYESDANCKSLIRKGIVHVADIKKRDCSDGFVILSGYPGQRKVKVAEMSKFGRPVKLRSSLWWIRELAASRPLRALSELRTAEELEAAARAKGEFKNQESEGEIHPNDGLTEAKELETYISLREELYKKTKDFDSKIIDFETAIRRPYYNFRPLDVTELENYHNYLDFIEGCDDLNKIRYVLCMEARKNTDVAENALARATHVFVKQPEIHLFAARFREHNGNIEGAIIACSFSSVCFLLPMLCQITMEIDGCRLIVSSRAYKVVVECLIRVVET